jgi:hypothetical protein
MSCNLATPYNCNPLQLPVSGVTQSPFVILTFGNEDVQITVGNESAPSFNNTAVIKSFEIGVGKPTQGTIEIIDQEGGTFQAFVDRILKHMSTASSMNNVVKIQFGWVTVDCNGSKNIISSPLIQVVLKGIQVEFQNGVVKYKIAVIDLGKMSFVTRENQTIGTDDKPIDLKVAIQTLLNKNEPKIAAAFLRRGKDGTLTEYKFQGKPKAAWSPDNENKLGAAMKWSAPFPTDQNKGIIPVWSTTGNNANTLIFLEDPIGACNENIPGCSGSAGTWIVNGGNCSNVLRFTPTIDFPAALSTLNTGGASASHATGASVVKEKPCGVQTPQTGLATGQSITSPAWNHYGPEKATLMSSKSYDVYEKSESMGAINPINAELRFQGNPYFASTVDFIGKSVAVVVINPYYIGQNGSGTCGDWLAKPSVNTVLSNKNWILKAVHHSIKEGSFVTTFNLLLQAPDLDIPRDSGFGGDGYHPQ